MVDMKVQMFDGTLMTLQVGKTWSLTDIKMELAFHMTTKDHENFTFIVINNLQWNYQQTSEQIGKYWSRCEAFSCLE